jgi:hypothetical protein
MRRFWKKQLFYTLAFIAVCLVISPHIYVQSTAFNISAGASQSTISSTLASAAATAGATTVNFASGNYNLGSQTTIPCPVGSMTIQGPAVAYKAAADLRAGSYSYATPYLTYLNGSVSGGSGFYLASCTHAITIQYFNWNGGQPTAGGGGFLYGSSSGNSNVTVQYNWIHGMYANTAASHNYDDGIWLDGGQSPTPVDSNITVAWNVFGDGASDCNPIMTLFTYDGGDYGSSGGYCGAIGVHISTDNIQISNNDFEHLEEPVKFFAGAGGPGKPTQQLLVTKATADGNDFGQYHRIAIEEQQVVAYSSSVGSYFNFTNNSFHDTIYASYGLWAISSPACCGGYVDYSSDNENNVNNNTIIQGEVAQEGGPNGRSAGAVEWWASNATASNNLMQGYWSTQSPTASNPGQNFGAIKWGQSTGGWTAANNQCQSVTTTGSINCVSSEGLQSTNPPTITGNTQTSGGTSAQTSIIPTIAVSGNTVTITDAGRTSGVGPQGNTSSYYTIDGTTPSTSSTFCGSSCTFTVANGTVVKALGMWGQQNQPHAYQTNYGWTPSNVATATVAGGSPTAATPTFSPATETFTGSVSVSISSTTSGAAIRYTTDGTTPTSGSTLYSGPLTISATTTVEAIAIESGYANSAVGTATYTLAGTPTITSGYQGNTGSINTLAVGAPGFNQVAYGVYSDGNTRTEPDAYGNTPSWSSSDTTILSVSPYVNSSNTGGAISCVAIGTASIKVSAGGVIFSTWGMTCTAATKTLTSIAISATGGATLTVGATNQTVLLCTYSDSSTDNCSTQVVVNTANIDDTLTNWKPVCVLPSCNPGGSNPPASTSQTINNATPSLDGESMLLSSTTSASSTQTNALWVYNSPTTCDACTDFVMYTPFYLSGATSYITSPEFDFNDFIHTGLIQITFASQCDLVGAHWQINNGFGSWVNTIVTCNPSFNAWHYATLVGHRNIGDTSCGGYPTLYFVSLTVDGTVHTLNQTLCAGALPATYASGILPQYQIDIGATTSAQTATMNIDKVYATASIPSTAATVNYATTDATKVSVNSSGLVTGVATGSAGITATSGTVTSNTLTYTVSNTLTLNSITLANVDGITALAVGQTEKFVATCNYSNSTALTCSQSADANGNLVSFNNSNVGAGTITNPQGIFTGTGAQTTNLTAVAAGVTSNTINFTVFPALPITFKLTGLQMQFNGNTITLGYK